MAKPNRIGEIFKNGSNNPRKSINHSISPKKNPWSSWKIVTDVEEELELEQPNKINEHIRKQCNKKLNVRDCVQACARQRLPDFLKSSRSPNNLMLSFISNPIKPQEDDHIWCSGTVILRQNRGRNCHSRRLAGVVWICHVHDLSFCKDMNANSSDHDSTGLKNMGSFSNMFKNHQQSTSVRDDQVFETTYRTSKHTHSFSKMRSQVGFTALRSWSCVLINGYCRSCCESSSGSCSFFKMFSFFPIHEMFVVGAVRTHKEMTKCTWWIWNVYMYMVHACCMWGEGGWGRKTLSLMFYQNGNMLISLCPYLKVNEQRSWMKLNSVPLLLRTILCYPTIHFGSRRPSVRNNVSNKQAYALFFQNAFTSWVHRASFLKLCLDQRLLPVVLWVQLRGLLFLQNVFFPIHEMFVVGQSRRRSNPSSRTGGARTMFKSCQESLLSG